MGHESLPHREFVPARIERTAIPERVPTGDGVFLWRDQVLCVWVQPQVNSAGVCRGIELLVRTLAGTTPQASIEQAEKEGSIHDLTSEMLQQAVRCLQLLRTHGENAMTVSVNVDPIEITQRFVDEIRALIESCGIDPRLLCIELLERRSISPDQYDALRSIAELGCHVAIDDYGTGYALQQELATLLRAKVPIDEVKIDRSLVMCGKAALVARDLLAQGVQRVVAEGVEQESELKELPEQCLVQGYFTGQPVPLMFFRRSLALDTAS